MNQNNELQAVLSHYQQLIESELSVMNWPSKPERLYQPLQYFMSLGGKRMRPVLCILAGELFGADVQKTMPAALALELFHNFTLLHDDIMDKAATRRGQPTVHQKWDENIAILSGDVLFVKAYSLLAMVDTSKLPVLMQVFNRLAREVCEGQQLDMDFQEKAHIQMDEYLEMIRLKTSVLLGGCMEMGALLAGASEKDCQLAYNFGEKLGLAFQIQDDVLDAYGDPEKFGKTVGGDILVNKHTFLRTQAENIADAQTLIALENAYAINEPKAKIEGVKAIFDSLGVVESANAKKQNYFEMALNDLAQVKAFNPKIREQLTSLAYYLIVRES
jgi:geranylgeranyl diphosphate synthase type II